MHIVVVALIPVAMNLGQNLSKVLYLIPENARFLMIIGYEGAAQ